MPLVRSNNSEDDAVATPPSCTKSNASDVLMSKEEFEANKRLLLHALRAAGDPPPRRMRPNEGAESKTSSIEGYIPTICACLEKNPGSKIVRGFKLFKIPLNRQRWGSDSAFKGMFHVVIAMPSNDNSVPQREVCYVDPNPPQTAEQIGTPYIFVPSSRIHAELSDAEVLSNRWFFGTVVGGSPAFATAIVIEQSVKGRRLSVIGTSPERCIAKACVKIRPTPHFMEWCKSRQIDESPAVVGEQCGFPVYLPEEEIDENDVSRLLSAASSSEERMVDGFDLLMFEFSTREALLAGKLTPDAAKERYMNEFDRIYQAMRMARAHRLSVLFENAGFRARVLR